MESILFLCDEAKEPYWILNSLNEDDFVQVLERIKLRGYPNLAKEIGKNIIGVRDGINGIDYPEGTKNIVIRHAIMDLRIQALSLDFNDSYQTKAIVEETFSRILNKRIEEYNRLGKE